MHPDTSDRYKALPPYPLAGIPETRRRLVAEGVDRAVEVGPGRTLKSLMKRIDRSVSVASAGTVSEIAELSG